MSRATRFMVLLASLVSPLILSGCDVDAIYVSRTELDFQRDSNPQFFDVANDNGGLGTIDVTIVTDQAWIKVAPTSLPCRPPDADGRVTERVEVRLDRSKITETGEHEGTITLSASGVKPVTVRVLAIQDSLTPTLARLNIVNPVTTFDSPYLVEFSFSLRDQNDRAITGEPAQFEVAGYEDDRAVGRPEGLALRRGAARQLWIEIVMDYSVYMRELENAIPEMERAATQVLLPSLNEDALISASGFYRDNLESTLIVPFTVDRQHVTERILAADTELFGGWASGARVYDALLSALRRFEGVNTGENDQKYIVLFCNGRDTSSISTAPMVTSAANALGVRIIVVGFGETIDSGDLITLAVSSNGRFISALELGDLQTAFERIIEDLNSQYVVRWASASRIGSFIPAMKVFLGDASASHTSNRTFRAQNYAGDPLQGRLVLMQSDTPGNSTVFLRADYVPYDISVFRLRVDSDYAFNVSVVGAGDDGLLGGWALTIDDDVDGAKWLTLAGTGPIPFASFGAMLRFDFAQPVDPAFTAFEVDNTLYADGQTFVVE